MLDKQCVQVANPEVRNPDPGGSGGSSSLLVFCFLFAKVFETNETLLFVDLVAEERRSGFPERSFQKSFSEVLLSERSLQKFFLPKTSRITRMPH